MHAFIGMTVRPATVEMVRQELLDMGVRETYVLFGPLDILCRLPEFENIEGLRERWLAPIARIGEALFESENTVRSTQTFIVTKPSPNRIEITPYAFIFLSIRPPIFEEMLAQLLRIRGIASADMVAGPYDVVCMIDAKNRNELHKIAFEVSRQISSALTSSSTMVVAPQD